MTIKNIPLDQLTAWKGNVRKTQNKASIPDLAASINAYGLQNNLVVTGDGKKFAVVAGCRRLAALKLLAKNGDIKADEPIPCRIENDEANLTAISLAENAMRENMHPADEFEAFKKAVDDKVPLKEIAARFGKTELYVRQRLKLANVSPKIIAAYRDEQIDLEAVEAYSIGADHATQEKVFAKCKNSAWQAKRMFTENRVAIDDGRLKFVTLKAYEAAGGQVETLDLFTEHKDGAYITDAKLLNTLFEAKLQQTVERVTKEGWKWVEQRAVFSYSDRAKFTQLEKDMEPLPEKQQKVLDDTFAALAKARKAVDDFYSSDEYDNADPDDEKITAKDDALADAVHKLEEKVAKINKGRKQFWSPETLAIAGAVVFLGSNGDVGIERGLCKASDKHAAKTKQRAQEIAKGEDVPEEDDTPVDDGKISNALSRYLAEAKSQAMTAELIGNQHVALAAVAHCLALHHFREDSGLLNIEPTDQDYEILENSPADKLIKAAGDAWSKRLPKENLWTWCLEQDTATLIELLSFCAAQTVHSWDEDEPLAKALKLDMTKWFTPTAENYFCKVGKPQILEAITEAKGKKAVTPAMNTLKKGELAKCAEELLAGSGWLPKPLR